MNDADEIIKEENADELYERKTFKVDAGQEPLRIDKWVQVRVENASRNKIQQSIEAGFLTVNGKSVKNNYKTKAGDVVSLMIFINPDYTEVKPEKIPLNIVYEDDDVLVLNKPPNMVVHPGVGNFTGTLLNGIAYHLQQQKFEMAA